MKATPVVPGLWTFTLDFVNAYLLDVGEGLVLIDTGMPGDAPRIVDAIRSIGREPTDVRHILVTHCHPDHAGGLAEIKRITEAPATMHPADAALVRVGQAKRPLTPTPGLFNAIICRLFINGSPTEIEPADIEHEVDDGAILPGDLRAIHVPGHCAGQLAFWWPSRKLLIVADAASHAVVLAMSPVHEDLEEGKRSLRKLAALDFEVACFGHGKPIMAGAGGRFRMKWGSFEDSRIKVS